VVVLLLMDFGGVIVSTAWSIHQLRTVVFLAHLSVLRGDYPNIGVSQISVRPDNALACQETNPEACASGNVVFLGLIVRPRLSHI